MEYEIGVCKIFGWKDEVNKSCAGLVMVKLI